MDTYKYEFHKLESNVTDKKETKDELKYNNFKNYT